MASSTPELSRLQRALIEGLAGGTEFYLTGGAALSGFYLHHRQSQDLDFFVVDPAELDALERRLEILCAERGWSIEEVRRFPGFRRFIVRDAFHEWVRRSMSPLPLPAPGRCMGPPTLAVGRVASQCRVALIVEMFNDGRERGAASRPASSRFNTRH